MRWLNHIRRLFGLTEHPPATSGETSVLFVLATKSPMSLSELSAETWIPTDELLPVVRGLEQAGRIRTTFHGSASKLSRLYWAIDHHER